MMTFGPKHYQIKEFYFTAILPLPLGPTTIREPTENLKN